MALALLWMPSVLKWSLYEVRTVESSNKGTKNDCLDEIEKLMLFDFVMATQGSDFCFSFYNALDTTSKKKSCLACNKVFQKSGELKG